MQRLSETTIQARAPAILAEAVEREAVRRMCSKSAIVREALVNALGLAEALGGAGAVPSEDEGAPNE